MDREREPKQDNDSIEQINAGSRRMATVLLISSVKYDCARRNFHEWNPHFEWCSYEFLFLGSLFSTNEWGMFARTARIDRRLATVIATVNCCVTATTLLLFVLALCLACYTDCDTCASFAQCHFGSSLKFMNEPKGICREWQHIPQESENLSKERKRFLLSREHIAPYARATPN